MRVIVGDIRLKNRREASEPAVEDEGGSGRQVQEPASGYDLNDDIPF